jgi:hypothetical protein
MKNRFKINDMIKSKIIIFNKSKGESAGERCAKPTIRKKNTVNIEGANGAIIQFDIFDYHFLNMQNGHVFITGKACEKRRK